MQLKINKRLIGLKTPPYIIAELSANHNGSLERALESISVAKNCGADAVKIQTYTADTMTIDCDEQDFIIKGGLWDGYKLYDLYKEAETPFEWHKALFDHAKKIGITIFSTPFDESAVDLLEKLETPAYKIASFEITDLQLIRYVAKTGKPIIISTGMSSEKEIEEAVLTARDAGCKDLIILHCISSYPAQVEQSNLKQITELQKKLNCIIGLSDHTIGTTASIISVALGACVIEKHFTISREDKGPDSEFSLEPNELKQLCEESKKAWLALGKTGYERTKEEEKNLIFRRSLYFVNDVNEGEIVTREDVKRIRPGFGLPPKRIDEIIGRKILKTVKRGQPVKMEYFENGF